MFASMETTTAAVSREVRALMARQGINQQDLAERLKWTRGYLARRLNGGVPWDLDDLDELATALDITLLQLLWPRMGALAVSA